MGIISSTKRKIGHFILDHFVTQDVIQQWRENHTEELLPPTLYITGPVPSMERNTDRIDVRSLEAAMRAQNIKVVRGKALDVPPEELAPTKLAPWYWNRINSVTEEPTVSIEAIKLQEKLRKRLDGETY